MLLTIAACDLTNFALVFITGRIMQIQHIHAEIVRFFQHLSVLHTKTLN